MRDKINEALKDAVKAKDKLRVGTLRLINAAIKDRDIAGRTSGSDAVSDTEILEILAKMVKQRQEAAVTYKDAGRDELATQELQEIEVIKDFMPQQMDEAAVEQAVKDVVAEIDATSLKDMGRTMAALKEKYAGQMDFGAANKVVKALLQ
jgi:hypothetical protein